MIYFLPFLMAALGRLSGWGAEQAGYKRLAKFPAEVAFGVAFGVVCSRMHGGDIYALLIGSAWTFLAFNFGHGNAYHDGTTELAFPDRRQTPIDWIMRPLIKLTGWAPRSTWYCRVFMGIKGLCIGATIFPYGLPLLVLWPLAYAISFRTLKAYNLYAEWMSGWFAGACLVWAVVS